MSRSEQTAPGADLHGPVFISYRQSDGTTVANSVARLLRAAGVPVWRDHNDLPPGDTDARLREAIAAGVSGAVVIITPDVHLSRVMRDVEIQELLRLHAADPLFSLQIINDVEGANGRDFDAPDRLLQLPAGTLRGVDQQPSTTAGQRAAARALAEVRVAWHRDTGGLERFELSVQSRNEGRASDVTTATLDLRFQMAPDGRLPQRLALEDLQWSTELLPTLYTTSRQPSISISGGSHLSIAFAIGAALPSTRTNSLEVRQGLDGPAWAAEPQGDEPATPYALTEESRVGGAPRSSDCAVYVDAVTLGPSDAAFNAFWDAHIDQLRRGLILRTANRAAIQPDQVPGLVALIMSRTRELWGSTGNGMVHLFLRVPFPLAVLLGRSSNTMRVTTYEWAPDTGPHYVPSLVIESGAAPSCVRSVLLTDD